MGELEKDVRNTLYEYTVDYRTVSRQGDKEKDELYRHYSLRFREFKNAGNEGYHIPLSHPIMTDVDSTLEQWNRISKKILGYKRADIKKILGKVMLMEGC